MRFLVLSDIHSELSTVKRILGKVSDEGITALIICGDITHFGSFTEAEGILRGLAEIFTPVMFVPGNCDPQGLASAQSIIGVTNLHGKYKEVENVGFLGVGGSPFTPFHTPFEMSENEIKKILEGAFRSSDKKLVLLSHTPPINTKVDLTSSGIHAGSQAIRGFLESKKPSLVLCGHIHEARGKDTIDGALIVNPGPASKGLWAMVDVNGEIKVKLGTL